MSEEVKEEDMKDEAEDDVPEEVRAQFHPVIRRILWAPNLFAALDLEPREDYTAAEIEKAYQRKVAELVAIDQRVGEASRAQESTIADAVSTQEVARPL